MCSDFPPAPKQSFIVWIFCSIMPHYSFSLLCQHIVAVKWVPTFHLVGDFQLPVLHVCCLIWKLTLVYRASLIRMSQVQQLPQLDIHFRPTRLCTSFGYILLRRQRKLETSVAMCCILQNISFSNLIFLFLQIWFGSCIAGNKSCSLFNIYSSKLLSVYYALQCHMSSHDLSSKFIFFLFIFYFDLCFLSA